VADTEFGQAAIARLDELRLSALEHRIDADLRAGAADELVAELEGLVITHPMREPLAARLMRALRAAGRRGAALEAYEQTRRRLVDQLGVEPSAELAALHLEILRDEPPPGPVPPPVPPSTTNLRAELTSFVGRDTELRQVAELLGAHRLITLTGPGGSGKTRLAVEAARGELAAMPDGVWLVELAPVGDPGAVAHAVATVLGITPQAGSTVAEAVARTLSGRQLLVVDNCEHVLEAAAELVEAILAHATSVTVMATSREGLRVGSEHLWPVPSLGVDATGPGSAGVELFMQRAQAVVPGFALDAEDDLAAVSDICRRLDGIALAIELAAARMVSMSAQDVRDRLGDRFRLLSGSRRGLERHQTLRHAVQWSYELLGDDERAVLTRGAVFAGGFDLAAALAVCGDGLDEYALLDVLDSLVRKSLVTVERAGRHARYGMLETIRQFAEDQLAATADSTGLRDRHARYFAAQALAYWDIWDGPRQRIALDWVEVEFANLRAGFRWATDQTDLTTAAAIAAHTTTIAWVAQRYEPAGWAEEILMAATSADLSRLPRVYAAASFCMFTGRPETALGYAQTAAALAAEPGYDPFDMGLFGTWEAGIYIVAGQLDRALDLFAALAAQPGRVHLPGLCGLLTFLPAAERVEEAVAIAEETVTAARADPNPYFVAFALYGYGRAFAQTDPSRALRALREGLAYAREQRLLFWEATIAQEAAGLEAVHGQLDMALSMFDTAIDSFHRAGNVALLAETLAKLAMSFDRIERPEIAATIYGASANYAGIHAVINLASAVTHLRALIVSCKAGAL
jgi:predicted ATPase